MWTSFHSQPWEAHLSIIFSCFFCQMSPLVHLNGAYFSLFKKLIKQGRYGFVIFIVLQQQMYILRMHQILTSKKIILKTKKNQGFVFFLAVNMFTANLVSHASGLLSCTKCSPGGKKHALSLKPLTIHTVVLKTLKNLWKRTFLCSCV